MDHEIDTSKYLKIDNFLKLHPDVNIDELVALNHPIWYMTRLNGESLNDLSPLDNEDKMHKMAKALQIKYYKQIHKAELYEMIIEKYRDVFENDISHANENNKKNKKNKKNKNKKYISHALRRLVWNTYINRQVGEHVCLCCESTMISQLNFECGHVISVNNGGKLTLENLRPICTPCNRSMNSKYMVVFMKEQNMPGVKLFETK